MPLGITVIIDDLPDALAGVGETLGNAGINTGEYCSFLVGGQRSLPIVHQEVEGSDECSSGK
ncbi:MAG: hypothetical protein QF579_00260 [Dehalococcoidia bacterium]|jgi:hypothetical protein|nr:hypothetical protein [Dehalococcoidia bacterium]